MMAELDSIEHRTVAVNGIRMHIAEKGQGRVVLLIHGFPQLWYSFRHQIISLSALGYHTIAPDLRGYGDTQSPAAPESYTVLHLVGDLIALLDQVSPSDKVFVVGHDWGALVAWYLCIYRPDRVAALINMSVVFPRINPARKPIEGLRATYGDDYYMCRFQKPGEIEGEIEEYGTERFMKKVLSYRDPSPLYLPKGEWIDDAPPELPTWLSQQDLLYYTAKFEATGFTGGLNYYRAIDLNWELNGAWTGIQIKVPVKFIVGNLDLTYSSDAVKNYIHNGGFKLDVPFLQEVVVLEGVGHFLQEEKPHEITQHIYNFINKF